MDLCPFLYHLSAEFAEDDDVQSFGYRRFGK